MPACKLTPEITETVLESVAVGCSDKASAQRAGIHPETLSNWLARGAEGEEPFLTFREAYARAQGERTRSLVSCIRSAAEAGDWRAAAHLLACLEPEQYSEKRRLEHTGAGGGPIKAETHVSTDTPDRAATVLGILAQVGGLAAAALQPDAAEDDGVHSPPADGEAASLPVAG